MQPLYVTLSTTVPSAWRLADWNIKPQQIAFQVISTGGSSWTIVGTLEDPTGTFPSLNSSIPTSFNIATGSANTYVSLGTSGVPISAYQFLINTQSSAAARVTFVTLQSGIG